MKLHEVYNSSLNNRHNFQAEGHNVLTGSIEYFLLRPNKRRIWTWPPSLPRRSSRVCSSFVAFFFSARVSPSSWCSCQDPLCSLITLPWDRVDIIERAVPNRPIRDEPFNLAARSLPSLFRLLGTGQGYVFCVDEWARDQRTCQTRDPFNVCGNGIPGVLGDLGQ